MDKEQKEDSEFLKNVKCIADEFKDSNYNIKLTADLLYLSLVGLKKIAIEYDVKMDELTVKEIVNYLKKIK
jgi:hypothetical protein